jgi:hypothetical protein
LIHPVSIGELKELLACEVGTVVCDDGVWHTKLVDDVQEELDGLLGIGFGDGFASIHFVNLSTATSR